MKRGQALAAAWQWLTEAGLLFVLPLAFYRGLTEQFSYPKIVLVNVLVIAALGVWALKRIWRGSAPPLTRFALPIALLVLAVLLSIVNSPAPRFALAEAEYFLCAPLWLFLLASSDRGVASARRLAALATVAGVVVAVVALAQWLGHDPLLLGGAEMEWGSMAERMRLYSTFGNPDFVAGYLIGAVFLALTLSCAASSRASRAVWVVCAAMMLAAIVGTQSHGAWAGLAVGLLAWFWLARRQSSPAHRNGRIRLALPTLFLLELALSVSVIAWYSGTASRASVLVPPSGVWFAAPMFGNLAARLLNQLAGRFYLWQVSWPLFTQHPLLGSGWGTLQLRFLELQAQFLAAHPEQLRFWSNVTQLHNDLLQLLFEAGVFGLGALVWLLWTYTQELRRGFTAGGHSARPWLAASAGGGVAILVDSIFNFQFAVPPTLILLFTLLAFPVVLDKSRVVAEASEPPRPGARKSLVVRILLCLAILGCCGGSLWQTARRAKAETLYVEGMRYEDQEDSSLSRAERAYRAGLALDPVNGRMHFGLARVLYEQHRLPEAQAEVETAEHTYADSHLEVLKGRIDDKMGLRSAALATLRHALFLDPNLQTVQGDIERLEKRTGN